MKPLKKSNDVAYYIGIASVATTHQTTLQTIVSRALTGTFGENNIFPVQDFHV